MICENIDTLMFPHVSTGTFSETGSEQGWEFNFINSIALFLIVNERISFPLNCNACTYRLWHFKKHFCFKIKVYINPAH